MPKIVDVDTACNFPPPEELEKSPIWQQIRSAHQHIAKIRERLPQYTPEQLEKFRAVLKTSAENPALAKLIAEVRERREQEIAAEQHAAEEEFRQREAEKDRKRKAMKRRRAKKRKLAEDHRREEAAARRRAEEETEARQREEEEVRRRKQAQSEPHTSKRGPGQPRVEFEGFEAAMAAVIDAQTTNKNLLDPGKRRTFVAKFLNDRGTVVAKERIKTLGRRIEEWDEAHPEQHRLNSVR